MLQSTCRVQIPIFIRTCSIIYLHKTDPPPATFDSYTIFRNKDLTLVFVFTPSHPRSAGTQGSHTSFPSLNPHHQHHNHLANSHNTHPTRSNKIEARKFVNAAIAISKSQALFNRVEVLLCVLLPRVLLSLHLTLHLTPPPHPPSNTQLATPHPAVLVPKCPGPGPSATAPRAAPASPRSRAPKSGCEKSTSCYRTPTRGRLWP